MSDKNLFLSAEEETQLNDALHKQQLDFQVKEVTLQNLMHLIKLRNKLGKNINFEKEANKRLKKILGDFDSSKVKQLLVEKDGEIRTKCEKDLEDLQIAFQLYTLAGSELIKEKTIDARIKTELSEVREILGVKDEE